MERKIKRHTTKKINKEDSNLTINTQFHFSRNPEQTTIIPNFIPLCMWFNEKLSVIWCDLYSVTLFALKDQIKTGTGIPTELQLLLYRGKFLNTDYPLEFTPYDNILIIVKGRGGMKSSDIGIFYLQLNLSDCQDWYDNLFYMYIYLSFLRYITK